MVGIIRQQSCNSQIQALATKTSHREHGHYTQLQAEKGDTCYDKDIRAKLILKNKFWYYS